MLSVQRPAIPLDYSKCNQTITIYHQNPVTKEISRIVIESGAFLDFRKNKNVDKTGSKESNSFLLVIPEISCRYLPAADFIGTPGTYTLVNLDKVQLGIGPVITTAAEWSAFIPAKVDGLVVVKYIDPKFWQAQRCHLEAGG